VGWFSIKTTGGKCTLYLDDKWIGEFDEAWEVADDLSQGKLITPVILTSGKVVDTSTLGIPCDVEEWGCVSQVHYTLPC
jgi:hypothetical protein